MFRPKVLAAVLNEANESSTSVETGGNNRGSSSGDSFTLLLNREGALLAASAPQNSATPNSMANQQPRVVSAIVSTVWALASQNIAALEADPLYVLIVDCEQARLVEKQRGRLFNWLLNLFLPIRI